SACPIQFLDKPNGGKKFAASSIKDVDVPVTVCLDHKLSRLTFVSCIDEYWRFSRVIVEQVMRRELEIPLQFAGVGIECQQAIRIEVVAGADTSFEIWRRIACAPKQHIQLRIVRAGHPGGATAVLIEVAWPT